MRDWSETFEEEVAELRRLRDELRVQMHLAGREVKDRFEQLEKRWHHLEARLEVVREGSRESLDDIAEAAKGLLAELKKGYRHVRDLL